MHRKTFAALFLLCLSASTLFGQRNRISAAIDDARTMRLPGHMHPRAVAGNDQGPVVPGLVLPRITLVFKPSANQQADLDRLLAEQQDPSSANYHHWLTPEEYADRFGLSADDLNKVASWLQDQGFAVAPLARSRNWVAFSGAAAQVESAFHTRIHHYAVNGERHFANASEPSIPVALGAVVAGIHGLNDFRFKTRRRVQQSLPEPRYNSGRG